jgi:hypothetical protein
VTSGVPTIDPPLSDVLAVLRVREASGAFELDVGARRYAGVFLYLPKAVALRDRVYLRLQGGEAVDVVGVVVATDGFGAGPRRVLRGARLTIRVTTVQRGGADIAADALATGRLDGAARPAPRGPTAYASSRMALPSLDGEPVPAPRATSPMQGTLDARTMADLVAHHVQRESNVAIEVTADHGLGGTVFIEGGLVVAAWAGAVQGLEAVLQLATNAGAQFRVRPGRTTVMRNVSEPPALVQRALAQVQSRSPFSDEPTLVDAHRTDASASVP